MLGLADNGVCLNWRKYIIIFAVSIAAVVSLGCAYINQLFGTVADNLMDTVYEITNHDVETIEGSLDNTYSRLGSVANRMRVYDVESISEAQDQMNLEAASSDLFNAIYMLDSDGMLYSSSYVRFNAGEHAYDELFADGRTHFAMLYNEDNGKLETSKESLIYGIRLDDLKIADKTIVALLGRSDLSIISDQLMIESFDGQGLSSVVNKEGYYIVSASPTNDISFRENFYDTLEGSRIEDGVTIEDIQRNISDGATFVVSYVSNQGEQMILSFAPVDGTAWSFVMSVPMVVFQQQFAPFITLSICMMVIMVVIFILLMVIIYQFMKRSVVASAESAARAEFLSNMSHEIRTPLNGIIGLNHLMERHLDDKEAMKSYVSKLDKAAQYLLSLVNDVLDMSKLQAGKVTLNTEPFDLRDAVDNVCDMQRGSMLENGITLHMEDVDIPHSCIVGDEIRISQILMNIISNAVKFTSEGGSITIHADQKLAIYNDSVTTTISISDTGCGMTQEFQRHIFDMFTQERESNSNSQKGTGLGMSISYLLAKQMGGDLSVQSALGKGSCFTLVISNPLGYVCNVKNEYASSLCAEDASAVDVSGSPEPSELPNENAGVELLDKGDGCTERNAKEENVASTGNACMNILVAEDNDLNADIICSILNEEGYKVVLASNGQEVVDIFSASGEGEFPIILMDAQMPKMNGYDAARAIRNLNRSDAATVKIFACTASTLIEDRNMALECGMDEFLPKPLDLRLMLKKIEEVGKESSDV